MLKRFLFNMFNSGPTPEEALIGFFPDMDSAVAWATGILADTGTDPVQQPVRAVRDIREANPRLGLVAAKRLIDELVARR